MTWKSMMDSSKPKRNPKSWSNPITTSFRLSWLQLLYHIDYSSSYRRFETRSSGVSGGKMVVYWIMGLIWLQATTLYLTALTPHLKKDPRTAPAHPNSSLYISALERRTVFIVGVAASQIKQQTSLHHIAEYIFPYIRVLEVWGLTLRSVIPGKLTLVLM